MFKYVISLLVCLTTLSSQGQYSNNIDSLSKKEIKRFLLHQTKSESAKNLIEINKALNVLAGTGYILSAVTFFIQISVPPLFNEEPNFTAPGLLLTGSLLTSLISSNLYTKAIKNYKNESGVNDFGYNLHRYDFVEIRDEKKVISLLIDKY